MLDNSSSSPGSALASMSDLIAKIPNLLRAEPKPVSYDMLFKDPCDGCARYDDVWGG